MADHATGRVIAVNPAAQDLLGLPSADLVGHPWHKAFIHPGAEELNAASQRAATLGTISRISVSSSGLAGDALVATLSTFLVSKVCYLLLQLDTAHPTGRNPQAFSGDLFDELDELPLGFVVTDGALCVQFGNRAFLDLTGDASREAIEGQNLLRWMDLTQEDLILMSQQLQLRQAAAVMTTSLSTRYGRGPMVEVTAIAVPDATSPHWGFVLRQMSGHPVVPGGLRKDS